MAQLKLFVEIVLFVRLTKVLLKNLVECCSLLKILVDHLSTLLWILLLICLLVVVGMMLFLVLLIGLVGCVGLYLVILLLLLSRSPHCFLSIGSVGLVCPLKSFVIEIHDFRVSFGSV